MSFDLAGHIQAALSVKLDDDYFRSNEDAVSDDILRHPYEFLGKLHEKYGSVVPLNAGVLDGVDFGHIWHQDSSRPSFLALGFETVSECFNDSVRFRHAHHGEPVFGDAPLSNEPPLSTPYKALVMQALGRPKVERLDAEIMRPAAEILADRVLEKRKGNFVLDFTGILPFIVISALFDLPPEWSAKFIKQAHDIMTMGHDPDAAFVALGQQRFYFTNMLYTRREKPGDDLLSWLAQAKLPTGEKLRTSEIIGLSQMLATAGTETTARVLGQLMTALLTNDRQRQLVANDKSLISATVGEALRWDGPVPIVPRAARMDTELRGIAIPNNSIIYCCITAANRDAALWNEPHRFDLERPVKPDLSFGGGAHRCVGNVLARREIETALDVILDRLPTLQLDKMQPPPEILGLSVRSTANIPYVIG